MGYLSKSVQLKDKTGNYLSPVTDIASLFYENKNGDDKIFRTFVIKDNFIVNTSFNNVIVGNSSINNEIDPFNVECNNYDFSSKLRYPTYNDTSIFVSDISIVPANNGNSKFRSFNIKRYDLSSIFLQYTPISYVNYYIYELNKRINDISTNIHDILQNYTSYEDATYKNKSYIELDSNGIQNAINNRLLIPGCIYALQYNSDVIEYIIGIANSSTSFSNNALGIIVKNNLFNINNSKANMFDINYEIGSDYHINITYMKDHHNNIAYFDFLNNNYIDNNIYQSANMCNNVFLPTCKNVSISGSFINNQVKYEIQIKANTSIKNSILNSSLILNTTKSITISNSQIDSNITNNLNLLNGCNITSSIIGEDISIYQQNSNNLLKLTNVIICKNTSININSYRTFENVYIGKNCDININKDNISNVHIDNNVILTEVDTSTYYTNYKIFSRN